GLFAVDRNRRHRPELVGANLGWDHLSDRDAACTVPTKVGTYQSDGRRLPERFAYGVALGSAGRWPADAHH
ncbi:hypothetical protein, partial [Stenotrophomonas maltophilia]|uniref:hypothetical protein n=1 Tax=Stenotrophomonas maltophilia TaxID=40324 RepID=UPI001C3F447E